MHNCCVCFTNAKSKSTEKLSSGYRINRSADDAAGLAISEKMRRQIRGLTQGIKNTQDGVSLCNRLEHIIRHEGNTVENTTAAESLIRDTDMATEMVTFSNDNILQQAGQAMLSQANQSKQGILQLLQ